MLPQVLAYQAQAACLKHALALVGAVALSVGPVAVQAWAMFAAPAAPWTAFVAKALSARAAEVVVVMGVVWVMHGAIPS